MDGWVTQLRKGLVEYCVLNVLRSGENYGFEIVVRLQSLDVIAVTESTVYPVLTRLKKDGYLKVRTVPSTSGPPRRYFALTRTGERRVAEMDDYWDLLDEAVRNLRNNTGERT